jgi:YVTN family beta-propeller protein
MHVPHLFAPRLGYACLRAALLAGVAAAAFPSSAVSDPPPGARVVFTFSVPSPRDVGIGFDSVWVTEGPSRRVTRIDPQTNTVSAVIPTPVNTTDITFGAGSVWVSSLPSNAVLRIDPTTNAIVAMIPSGGLAPEGIAYFDGYVWVANHHGSPTGSIAKIDPATDTVLDVIPLGTAQFTGGPTEVAAGAGSVWTGVPNLGAVARIDPTSDQVVATIPVNGVCAALETTDTAVWVAGGIGPGCSPGITKLDPATNQVIGDKINAGGPVSGLGLGLGSLWFGAPISDFLGRIDPSTDAVVGQLKLPGSPNSGHTPTGFDSVWVGDSADSLLFRVEPE